MNKIKSIFLNFTILMVSTTIFVSIAEFTLQKTHLLDAYTPLTTQPVSSAFVFKESPQNDRDFKWYNILQTSKEVPNKIMIQDKMLQLNTSTKKIFLLGDSGTFGSGVNKEDTFSSKIQIKLQHAKPPINIYNMGIPGATPPDVLYLFKNYLIKYNPTMVVFTTFMANDINQSLMLESYNAFKKQKQSHFKGLPQLSKLYRIIKILIFHQMERLNPHSAFKDERGLEIIEFADGEFSLYQKKYSKVTQKAVDNFFSVIKELHQLCIQNNIKFVLSFIPTRSQLLHRLEILPDLPNAIGAYKQRNLYDQNQLDFDKPYFLLKKFTINKNITFVDIIEKDRFHGVNSILIPKDDHLNPVGHQQLADEIVKKTCPILDCFK